MKKLIILSMALLLVGCTTIEDGDFRCKSTDNIYCNRLYQQHKEETKLPDCIETMCREDCLITYEESHQKEPKYYNVTFIYTEYEGINKTQWQQMVEGDKEIQSYKFLGERTIVLNYLSSAEETSYVELDFLFSAFQKEMNSSRGEIKYFIDKVY